MINTNLLIILLLKMSVQVARKHIIIKWVDTTILELIYRKMLMMNIVTICNILLEVQLNPVGVQLLLFFRIQTKYVKNYV